MFSVFSIRIVGVAVSACGISANVADRVVRSSFGKMCGWLTRLSSTTDSALRATMNGLSGTSRPFIHSPPLSCEISTPRMVITAGVSLMILTLESPGAIQRPLPVIWSARTSMRPALAMIGLMVTCNALRSTPSGTLLVPPSMPSACSSALMRVTSLL
jgi:hypothetical protein